MLEMCLPRLICVVCQGTTHDVCFSANTEQRTLQTIDYRLCLKICWLVFRLPIHDENIFQYIFQNTCIFFLRFSKIDETNSVYRVSFPVNLIWNVCLSSNDPLFVVLSQNPSLLTFFIFVLFTYHEPFIPRRITPTSTPMHLPTYIFHSLLWCIVIVTCEWLMNGVQSIVCFTKCISKWEIFYVHYIHDKRNKMTTSLTPCQLLTSPFFVRVPVYSIYHLDPVLESVGLWSGTRIVAIRQPTRITSRRSTSTVSNPTTPKSLFHRSLSPFTSPTPIRPHSPLLICRVRTSFRY